MIKRLISLCLSILTLIVPLLRQNRAQWETDRAAQAARIAELERRYAAGEVPPVNEAGFFDGDLQAALDGGIRFNELSFIATHNSYQTESVPAFREIYTNLSALTFGLVSDKKGTLNSDTLTQQLNLGIRSLELDIETTVRNRQVSFVCMHSPVYDMTSNCCDFALALKEIALWSKNNPAHLPVTVIIEPKKVFIPMRGMRYLNLKYTNALDALLRNTLGDMLVTPADMLRGYESFAAMRAADDWLPVRDLLGKVLILLHDTNVTQEYIHQDVTLRSQAMFPMLRYNNKDDSYAGFLLINKPAEALAYSEEIIDRYKLIVRTQVDTVQNLSQEATANAFASRAQILSTDHPMKANGTEETYSVYYGDRKTVRAIR